MYSQKPILLLSRKPRQLYYTAKFRAPRKDKGRKRGRRLGSLFNRRHPSVARKIAGSLLSGGLPVVGEVAATGGVAYLLGQKRGNQSPTQPTVIAPKDKFRVGLQYLQESSSLGASPAIDTVGSRLRLIGKRIQRGINTSQDINKLPISRQKRLLASLGIARSVGQEIFQDLRKPITLR